MENLMHAHMTAQANETAAFNAIEGAGTDEQWDAYFDAQQEARTALAAMLKATRDTSLRMIKDAGNRHNVTAFFDIAMAREGDAREKAILKAYELAALTA